MGGATKPAAGVAAAEETKRLLLSDHLSIVEMKNDPMVKWTRLLTLLLLVSTTVVVGVLTYTSLSQSAPSSSYDLETQFSVDAGELLDASALQAREVIQSLQLFGELYQTVATAAGKTLPFVTLTASELEPLAQSTRTSTGATHLVYVPWIVNDDERQAWQAYSNLHGSEWLQSGYDYYSASDDDNDHYNISESTNFRDYVWKYTITTNGLAEVAVESPRLSAPYAPSWQSSPPPHHPNDSLNFDYASDPVLARMMQWTVSMGVAALSPPVTTTSDALRAMDAGDVTALSILLQPLLDATELKGHIAAAIPWTQYFSNSHSSQVATEIVITSSCDVTNQSTLTLRVTWDGTVVLGTGDLHDTTMDAYQVVREGRSFVMTTDDATNSDYYCGPTFTAYPASASNNNNNGDGGAFNDAAKYTAIFVILMVLSIGLFAFYDMTVWRTLEETEIPVIVSAAAAAESTNKQQQTAGDGKKKKEGGGADNTSGGSSSQNEGKGELPAVTPASSDEETPAAEPEVCGRQVAAKVLPSMAAAAGIHHDEDHPTANEVKTLLSAPPDELCDVKKARKMDAVKSAVANLEAAAEKKVTTADDANNGVDTNNNNNKSKEALMKFVGTGAAGGVRAGIKGGHTGKPIAELFPEATVLFADISGFTAWSSIREPSQVFMLLESIFGAFDKIANERNVFKVETVGDCYVAVCGLPEPNTEHALVMARFARECMEKVNEVISELELTLGPDTAELAMRFGLHSGPVTAGVLRGDRARFQLFGDTVNTASRIETTGKRNRIHLSEQTASLIIAAGFKSWVIEREDEVQAKGKGLIKTYWLLTLRGDQAEKSNEEGAAGEKKADAGTEHLPKSSFMERIRAIKEARASKQQRISRLIDWNSEMLIQLLKQVVARRNALQRKKTSEAALAAMAKNIGVGTMVVEEVAEIITLPEFDARLGKSQINPKVDLPPGVTEQTRKYVAVLAGMYRNNPFHNFEHASHVTMSVSKLLSRIVAPQLDKSLTDEEADRQALLHDHTYGITSDPLTQFAVVLSALIHDVDHRGVPNFILIQEDKHLAAAYQNKSVAEQNSLDLAWEALMRPEFEALRACIFSDISELRRFRQLLVNSVIATDIFDKELATARKARWDKAFSEDFHEAHRTAINRKATIVIEHLIQASDVAHTMQHWHVYTKWNERLFEEMYSAFQTGRWDRDPSVGWFEGEIGFLDNYVIPLAKKLKNCGVFGVASDEYLNYAEQNRREWQARGKEIVATFVERHTKKERAAAQAAEDGATPKKVPNGETSAVTTSEEKKEDNPAETKSD